MADDVRHMRHLATRSGLPRTHMPGLLCYQCCVLDPAKRSTFAYVAEALQAIVDEAEALV